MKFTRRLTFLIALFTSLWAFPQGNFQVDLQLINANAQIFPIGDFDFARTGLVDPYYIVQIQNLSNEPQDLILCLEVRYNGDIIAQSESDIIPQVPSSQQYVLTSQAINQNIASINGQPVRFLNTTVDFTTVNELESQVLSTGRAPAGTYQVRMFYGDQTIGLDCASAALSDPFLGDNVMTITNPTTLEPLFPGRSANDSEVEEVGTLFPFFQWQSDIDPASFGFQQAEKFASQSSDEPPFYTLQVFEKYDEDESIDDVLSHPPVLSLDKFKQNFFQYPTESDPLLTSGEVVGPVRPLRSGATYYWQITSVIPTAIGADQLESDVFRFKVSDLANAGNSSRLILQILQQMLGPRYGIVNQELVEKGFEPTGDISVEGTALEVSELLQYLNAIIQGKATIKEVEVY
ncbi:MAG: hypothetical protein ACRBF0_21905 [Calditrichia bacterium]